MWGRQIVDTRVGELGARALRGAGTEYQRRTIDLSEKPGRCLAAQPRSCVEHAEVTQGAPDTSRISDTWAPAQIEAIEAPGCTR